jgi:hypothetical protein
MMGQLGAATAAADADSAVTSASATTHGSWLLVLKLSAAAAARAILMNYLDFFFYSLPAGESPPDCLGST